MLRQALLDAHILKDKELISASPAGRDMITLAHTVHYYESIISGTVDQKIVSRIGLPWSRELVIRSLKSVGGSIQAASAALISGVSGNLGGGTHHAMADMGQGFCVFNDLAVTTLFLIKNQLVRKVAILDLDAHQGNGNASILGDIPEVFILSVHGEKSYPYHKVASTIDVALPEDVDDHRYIKALQDALPLLFKFQPDILLFIAGVDPLKGDRFGRMKLSLAGIAERDRVVISEAKSRNIPLTMVMGGGYAQPIQRTVEAHLQTYKIIKEMY